MAIRSALGSVPTLARSPSAAAAAASGWRRVLSPALHGDTIGVWGVKAISHDFLLSTPTCLSSLAAAATGGSGWRRLLSSQSGGRLTDEEKKDIIQMFEAALSKQALEFDRKLADHKAYVISSLAKMQEDGDISTTAFMDGLKIFGVKCSMRANSSNAMLKLAYQKHEELKNDLLEKVQSTRETARTAGLIFTLCAGTTVGLSYSSSIPDSEFAPSC